jgi:hypothetical protein
MKLCRACNTQLINKRSHCTTCSSKCRNVAWRQSRITMLPVTFMLNIANFALVKNAAEATGVTVAQFAHDRLFQTMECEQ